jgi:2-C-methyl-D-erythritol 4-phosphate cytidylyltransferase
MKIAAILLCAGTGDRFFNILPKQFHMLGEKKLYLHALDTLKSSYHYSEIAIVHQRDHLKHFDPHPDCKMIEGGSTRQESVFLGLKSLNSPDSVIIFESARPFITKDLIEKHIAALKNGSTAINTCIPCTDTINIQQNGKITSIPNRNQFLSGQTPQSFNFSLILNAHKKTEHSYTDDCGLLISQGHNIHFEIGSPNNIKITKPLDLIAASAFLRDKETV